VHNSKDGSRQTSAQIKCTVYYGTESTELTQTIGTTPIEDSSIFEYTPKTFGKDDPEPTYEIVLKIPGVIGTYAGASSVEWTVCTKGAAADYGDWSTPRTIDIYEPAKLSLEVPGTITSFPIELRANAEPKTDTHFPTGYNVTIVSESTYETTDNLGNFKIVNAGDIVYSRYFNPDSDGKLELYLQPSSITLENGMEYNVTCRASMSSGLTVDTSSGFIVDWEVSEYEPNAEIGINNDLLTSSIRPYCETVEIEYYEVKCAGYQSMYSFSYDSDDTILKDANTVDGKQIYAFVNTNSKGYADLTCYTHTGDSYVYVKLNTVFNTVFNTVSEKLDHPLFGQRFITNPNFGNTTPYETVSYIRTENVVNVDGLSLIPKSGVTTLDGLNVYAVYTPGATYYAKYNDNYYTVNVVKSPVYVGMNDDGEYMFFTTVEKRTRIDSVYLSVYRREFDGSFTEIATDLDAENQTTVTDPHPALDYARYRIVATDKDTGHVNYYDCPGYYVGGIAAVLQWDEEYRNFDALGDIAPVEPELSGYMLKLPYNIDVSDSSKPEVTLVEYIGRSHPVSYYGTQIGSASNWNMVIDKNDTETLYALRRLSRWLGDVYVREPSGSGYWAQVTVSFSQNHCEVTIPVSLSITRVEGGA
jgi:hypothetical protein